MAHTKITLLSTLSIAIGVCMVTGAAASSLEKIKNQDTIRIAIANEIPYGYSDMEGNAKGMGPDVAKHIMEKIGVNNIKWVTTNFGSLIPGLQADRFDMVAAEMAILPQRCQEIIYSEPNSSYGEGLLVTKGNPHNLHSYEDFADSDKKVAIMAGADQLEMLQKLGVKESHMVTIANNADAISTVSTGRAAAYAATSLTVGDLASKSNKVEAAAEFTDPIVDGVPVRSWGGFAFAKGSEDLRDAVNKELSEFKQTDDWQAIINQYGFSDTDATESFNKTTKQLCAG